jgi:hypothetical protein
MLLRIWVAVLVLWVGLPRTRSSSISCSLGIPAPQFSRDYLAIPRYDFDGRLPNYDLQRGVHAQYRASDQLVKESWSVKPVGECLNLKGLASTAAFLRRQRSPALLIVLPVNRQCYAYNRLDTAEFDRRYEALAMP